MLSAKKRKNKTYFESEMEWFLYIFSDWQLEANMQMKR